VHGYIHGYEAGFHRGDLDLQLGHQALTAPHKFHAGDGGYRSNFGDKHVFLQGFQQGLLTGYGDAYHGVVFRGVADVRRAAEGVSADIAGKKDFDRAIWAGYQAGWQEGKRNPLTSIDPHASAKTCLAARHNAAYCDPYGRGFGLGYADGSVVQMGSREAETASAR
jgi:hypothetical protein